MAKTKFICPYCFEEHRVDEIEFRCFNSRCGDFPDEKMTLYEMGDPNNPIKLKRTFNKGEAKESQGTDWAKCPECGEKTHKVICPSCHNLLPESTISGTDMIISVVGARASGKSHFVGVLINELRNRIAPSFDGALEGFDDSYARWERYFAKALYDNNVKLELTRSSLQNVDNGAYRPLIFKLKLPKKKKFFFGKDGIETFTFVFFDTAGEDLNDEDVMSTVNKYIYKSAGIIFLLDPCQLGQVANKLDEKEIKNASPVDYSNATRSDEIITRVSNLIRNDRNLSQDKKIDIPVAAVFSKFDILESILPQGLTVLNPSPHCRQGAFDLADWHNVDSEIRSLLTSWDEQSFIANLDSNYEKYSFFGVSALGFNNNPDDKGHINRPQPHRIEDPILWLLEENKVIKANK